MHEGTHSVNNMVQPVTAKRLSIFHSSQSYPPLSDFSAAVLGSSTVAIAVLSFPIITHPNKRGVARCADGGKSKPQAKEKKRSILFEKSRRVWDQ